MKSTEKDKDTPKLNDKIPETRYTNFHTEKKWLRHLNDHLHEYEGFTPVMYLARATELLNALVDGVVIESFVDKDGFLFRYDHKLNDFAIGHCSGSISTLFKPVDGRGYWEEQKKKYGGG